MSSRLGLLSQGCIYFLLSRRANEAVPCPYIFSLCIILLVFAKGLVCIQWTSLSYLLDCCELLGILLAILSLFYRDLY